MLNKEVSPSDAEFEQKTENAKRYSELMAISQPLVTDQMFSAMILQNTLLFSMLEEGRRVFQFVWQNLFRDKVANLDLPEVCEEAKKTLGKKA